MCSAPKLTLPLVARGEDKLGIDGRGIPRGTYDYQLLLKRAGEAPPLCTMSGTVTLRDYVKTGCTVLAVNANGSIPGAMLVKSILKNCIYPVAMRAEA